MSMKNALRVLLAGIALVLAYLLVWPVPIEPLAWRAPPNPGYTGAFAINKRLAGVELLPIGPDHGPEDVVLDDRGRIYAATAGGHILRLAPDGTDPKVWAVPGGRPLGIAFDRAGNLIVADAYRGLLAVDTDANVRELVTRVDGVPLGYVNNVDVGSSGRIYFSDASRRFSARELGTYPASLLDLMEHRRSGRLLMHDPATGHTEVLLEGLSFANGVAVAPDEAFVLIAETGEYRVWRHWLTGPERGRSEPLIEALPGFPDNLTTGLDGRFWIGLISPRNRMLDALSERPMLRKMVQRLPAAVRPKAEAYGHVIAIDRDGRVTHDLQDPAGGYPLVTSVTETADYLYLGSLIAPAIARLPWQPDQPDL